MFSSLLEVWQQPAIRNPVAISLGAIAGALSRYYLTLWFAQHWGTNFPYGTFFINLSGCLGMGFFATLAVERTTIISPELRLLIAVGFLGAYTTFSTYGFDTIMMWRDRNLLTASFYWASSAILGIISIQCGIILARLCK